MGLHGNGLFGSSSANARNGHKKPKCPHCGVRFTTGGRNLHNSYYNEETGEVGCPYRCEKCGEQKWDWSWEICTSCGHTGEDHYADLYKEYIAVED